MGGKRAKPVYGASAYIRRDLTINGLRSGIDNDCSKCGQPKGVWCTGKGGKRLMYNHKCRRAEGKRLADELVLSRGRKVGA